MKKQTALLAMGILVLATNTALVKANENTYSSQSETSKKVSSKITFKDANLEKVIKESLELGDEDVTTENIQKLEKLVTDDAGIKDLSGLEYATNLKLVTFKSEEISSLSPLKNLKGLYSVGVPRCQNLPMSEVLSLPNLTELDLTGLKYSTEDFSQLSKYNNMTYLVLNGCGLKDITFTKNMNHLKYLQVSANELSNIDSLKSDDLIGLWANNNHLSDINLNNIPNLQRVYLEHNEISSLSNFNVLKNITHIYASYNKITNLSFKDNSSLTLLDVKGNQISDISLENLPKLDSLALNDNEISTITKWESLPVLKSAIFTNNPGISDINFLNSTTSLETLSLQKCSNIKDLKPLANLQKLTLLYLNYIPLTDQSFEDIGIHKSLLQLALNSTGLTNISFLSYYPNLTTVALSSNHITDISALPQSITIFACLNQTVQLPKTSLNTGTLIKLKDRNNITPNLSDWVGTGTLKESDDDSQVLTWSTKGDNTFKFESQDRRFSGTVQQLVE